MSPEAKGVPANDSGALFVAQSSGGSVQAVWQEWLSQFIQTALLAKARGWGEEAKRENVIGPGHPDGCVVLPPESEPA